jgi:hypothetical protein
MGLSLQYILLYADEEEDIFNSIVTGEELRVHHYQPEWKHPSSPSTMKLEVEVTPSAGKVMLAVFWDSLGFRSLVKM